MKNISAFSKRNIKFAAKVTALSLCAGLILSLCSFFAKCEAVYPQFFRLHILAASDSEDDQALKLKVRDEILKVGGDIFGNTQSVEEAKRIAAENLPLFRETAINTLRRYGCGDDVSVSVENAYFDTRCYDRFTLPAGKYCALRVVIGGGEGHNWWCVMYPPMCLDCALDTSEYLDKNTAGIISNGTKYRVKFKIVEIFDEIVNDLTKYA